MSDRRVFPPAAYIQPGRTTNVDEDTAAFIMANSNLGQVVKARWSDVDRAVLNRLLALVELGSPGSANGFASETRVSHAVLAVEELTQHISAAEVAGMHGVSEQAVTKACRTGRLKPSHRVGTRWFVSEEAARSYRPRRRTREVDGCAQRSR